MTRQKMSIYGAVSAAALLMVVQMGAKTASADDIAVPDNIKQAGKLVFCSDISGPPLEYYDESGKPIGVEIDLGTALAKQLDVSAVWNNTAFSGIIPALQAKQCDAILSQLIDKPARHEVVDFIDYMKSSESFLVDKGNPKGIKSLADLSGKKVAVENGTTMQTMLDAQNKKFTDAGQPPLTVVVYPKDTDALQALQFKQVDAYGTTLESASYYMTKAPGVFEVGGDPFAQVAVGVAVRKDDKQLTEALGKALAAIKADGTYSKILTQWNLVGDTYP